METPVPLVDLDRLERNLDRMAGYAAQHGLALRPHTKTHKSPRIAAEQIRRGAIGLTCATLLEAEVMAEASDDLLLAYPPVGAPKLQRLMSLPEEADLTVALDSVEVAGQLAGAAWERGRRVGVSIVSGGSTPTVWTSHAIEGVTESTDIVLSSTGQR